jgi:hypothetical protein
MARPTPQKGAWTIVVLLFFFMLINFADKVIIGLAGVPIMKDLALTPQEFGLVNSSFFFLFSLSAIATGFLVNHVQTRWVLLAMALVWALTQFPMLGTAARTLTPPHRLGAGERGLSGRLHATTSIPQRAADRCRLLSSHRALALAWSSPSPSSATSSSSFPGTGRSAYWVSWASCGWSSGSC